MEAEPRLEVQLGPHGRASQIATLVCDDQWMVTWASPTSTSLLHLTGAAIVGAPLQKLFGADVTSLASAQLDDTGRPVEIHVRVDTGGASRLLAGTFERLDVYPPATGILVTLADITAVEELHDAYSHALDHDSQTRLANSALFDDRLRMTTQRHLRDGGSHAVIIGDVDRLGEITATYGRRVADTVLEVIGARVGGVVRGADTAARLGPERFAILLDLCSTPRDAELVAGRLQQTMKTPIRVGEIELVLSMTCGIALADANAGSSLDELVAQPMRDAETALHEAIRHGPGRRVVARDDLRRAAGRRAAVDQAMTGVVERGELLLHYQPIINLETLQIKGVEALLRWQHPELGMISPGEFIPIAENSGLIVPIGSWVLQEACAQVAQWNRRFPSDTPLYVSINVSALQLARGNLPRDVAMALAVSGTPERSLTLELTETALVENREVANQTLLALRELGVRLALDDFGTGSSLEHLQQFRFDEIKIERQFATVDGDPGESLADALIGFGKSLGVTTVAEGIETREQLERFQRLGCDHGQGYFFGRPAVGVEIEALLAARATHIRVSEARTSADRETGGSPGQNATFLVHDPNARPDPAAAGQGVTPDEAQNDEDDDRAFKDADTLLRQLANGEL